MISKIFTEIPFTLELEELYTRLQIRKKESFSELIKKFSDEAVAIANPKGLYKEFYIEEKGENFIVINGKKLTGKIIRKNTDKISRIIIFLATCGSELQEWSLSKTDLIENFIADAIQEQVCRIAVGTVIKEIDFTFKLLNPSSMNPGSLDDWPIEQQKVIFELIDKESKQIAVSLNENFLMHPVKSVSGIRFAGEVGFCNCQMCLRKNCPTRITEYLEHL